MLPRSNGVAGLGGVDDPSPQRGLVAWGRFESDVLEQAMLVN